MRLFWQSSVASSCKLTSGNAYTTLTIHVWSHLQCWRGSLSVNTVLSFSDVCPRWRQRFYSLTTTSIVMKLETVWQVTAAVVESAKQQYVGQYSFESAIVTL